MFNKIKEKEEDSNNRLYKINNIKWNQNLNSIEKKEKKEEMMTEWREVYKELDILKLIIKK